ncbi:23S rRNA (adenine(2503)-C(2))-methyltransferase RlmN [Candidatus Cyanaurora vandensis]|uniref:23S rRNA (adenine(2503)-C(2))-methyltransferase RlmN n=1 Tax=Candidatus Cyanaurora vandensis TaxID=2714958 RepID=UPI00257C1556|nr:23S rRNA (adenine(2503)-C(2))-methyltransferase RlmN [Candidatus Cyanaurora vandensis]
MSTTPPLLGQSYDELSYWLSTQGEPPYRAKQLHQWLYTRNLQSLDEVTVFSKRWREANAKVKVGRSQVLQRTPSPDGTVKYLLGLADGENIETVGIPTAKRLTVCVSSQVGCPMACTFCATGKSGFARNLQIHEILDQVLTVQADFGRRVSHIVFMGMGEPLLNLKNLHTSVERINEDIGISARNITISTVGVKGRIRALGQYRLQTTLAVSLHAPNPDLRLQLIPSAQHYPLDELLAECKEYMELTSRRFTFEYTLLKDVNDQDFHARELAQRVRGFQCHVNLIPYNPVAGLDYKRPTPPRVQAFLAVLEAYRVQASVRQTRGSAEAAACGQLRRQILTTAIN